MLDAKISLVPTHQLIVLSTLLAPATEIRTHKATKIHTLKPLTYGLFFQNSSINATVHGRLEMRNFSSSVDQHCIFNVSH